MNKDHFLWHGFLLCSETLTKKLGLSSIRNFDINLHVTIRPQPKSLLLAHPRRLDAEPSITSNNDKKIELSDENSMETVTGKSLSLLNTCNVPLVKYVF